jgi:hypothetical protein
MDKSCIKLWKNSDVVWCAISFWFRTRRIRERYTLELHIFPPIVHWSHRRYRLSVMPNLEGSPSRVSAIGNLFDCCVVLFQAELTALDNFGRQSRHLQEHFANLASWLLKPFPSENNAWLPRPQRSPTVSLGIDRKCHATCGLFDDSPQSQEPLGTDFGLGFRSLDDCSIRRLDEIGPSLLIRLSRHHCEFYLARVIPACSAPHFFRGAGRIVVLVRPDSGHLGSHRPDPDVACGSPS